MLESRDRKQGLLIMTLLLLSNVGGYDDGGEQSAVPECQIENTTS